MKLITSEYFKHLNPDMAVCLSEEQLKQLQKTLIYILKDVIEFCEKNNITYSLGSGSVLGAVRHKGMIPWDDDIDINMPRKDYMKFIELFEKEYEEKYWLHTPEKTKNHNLLYCRVRLKGTCVVTRDDFCTQEKGAFIDVFIIENTFDNKLLRDIHGVGSLGLGFLQSCRKFYRDKNELIELSNGNKSLLKVIKIKALIGLFISIFSVEFWTKIANSWNAICKNDKSKYVTIPVGRKLFFGETYLRKSVCVMKKMLFEGMYVCCPQDAEDYLRILYGDYMQIPKEADKEKHMFLKPFVLNEEIFRQTGDQ